MSRGYLLGLLADGVSYNYGELYQCRFLKANLPWKLQSEVFNFKKSKNSVCLC